MVDLEKIIHLELNNKTIDDINYKDVVCYAFVGGNPWGSEGDTYIFECNENGINVYYGNVYFDELSREKVYEKLNRKDDFFTNGRCRKKAEGYKCLSYYMGYYVFVREYMAMTLRSEWRKVEPDTIYNEFVNSVQNTCKAHENYINDPDLYYKEYNIMREENKKLSEMRREREKKIANGEIKLTTTEIEELYIDEIDLSLAAYNRLKKVGINTVKDFLDKKSSGINNLKNVGPKTVDC